MVCTLEAALSKGRIVSRKAPCFSVPGSEAKTLASKDEIKWDKTPTGPVVQGVFTIIGEMGMTGQVILLDQVKWDALQKSKLISHFFIALLWGGTPLKIVDDAVVPT